MSSSSSFNFRIELVHRNAQAGSSSVLFAAPSLTVDIRSLAKWSIWQGENRILAIYGEAYLNDKRVTADTLSAWITSGKKLPDSLDGSFIIVAADRLTDSCTIYTDRTASRKVYYRQNGSELVISDNLLTVAGSKPALDEGAWVGYVLNGITLENRTLFAGVRSVPGASAGVIQNSTWSIREYWRFEIDSSFTNRSEKGLIEEFGELLYAGIARRLGGDSRPLFLSLSGGYDSTCILASAIRALGSGKDLRSFSYRSSQDSLTDSDAVVAAEATRRRGVEHRIISIPDRNLSQIIDANAKQALATANPCTEFGLWDELDHALGFESGSVRLFFGDNAFGHDPNWRLATHADAMAWLPMPGPEEFSQLLPFLRENEGERVAKPFEEIFSEVLSRGASLSHAVDEKDFYYFEQRVRFALMPWRERFCSRHGEAVNPLLDSRVLDFYRHLPPEHRKRRRLYRKTVETMYPDFFRQKRATLQGSMIDLRLLFRNNSAWAKDRIHSLHPTLDSIVSAKALNSICEGLTTPGRKEGTGWKGMAKRLFKNTTLGETIRSLSPRSHQIPRETILLRILISDATMKFATG